MSKNTPNPMHRLHALFSPLCSFQFCLVTSVLLVAAFIFSFSSNLFGGIVGDQQIGQIANQAPIASLRSIKQPVIPSSQIENRFKNLKGSQSSVVEIFVSKSPDDFNSILLEAESSGSDKLYILFFSEYDAYSLQPWCSDCARAEPILRYGFFQLNMKVSVVLAMIEKVAYKTDPTYSYRMDPRFNLKRIPTLALWNDGKVIRSLGDKDCQNLSLVLLFLNH